MDGRTGQYERIWSVFQRYRTLLYCRAQRVTADTELAEETLEEALVRLLGRAGHLSGLTEPQLLAYAAATVHNCALDAARQNGYRERMELPLPEESGQDAGPAPAPQPSAEERYLLAEDRELLRRAMQRLTDGERNLILRRYFLDESYEEIGTQTGEKAETVRVQVFRIRKKLLGLLTEEGYEHG